MKLYVAPQGKGDAMFKNMCHVSDYLPSIAMPAFGLPIRDRPQQELVKLRNNRGTPGQASA